MLHIVNSFELPVSLLKSYSWYAGVQDALVQWWYGHNAVAFFLTTPYLGLMYYFLPKAANRPVYSYRLSIIHFWSLIFIYIWAGPHHLLYTALPDWAQSLGVVFSVMLIAPSWGGMLNGLFTLRGAWDKVREDPILKFMVIAITAYGMATFEGPMLSLKSVNAISHFTDWTIAHVHVGALGWNGFFTFSVLYYIIPRIFNTQLYSKKLANTHFWIGVIGILLYTLPIYFAGFTQSTMWKAFTPEGQLKYQFLETVQYLKPFYLMRAVGGAIYLAGVFVMVYNLAKTNLLNYSQLLLMHVSKILIIEDNDEVRENKAEILMLSDYEVITAANGKEGVEVALAQRPDLIVCDIMMPVLDGYGVLHLLSKHEETATIPFIFLTAKAEKADLRKGMEMGADDYLTKPFDGIELLNAVEVRLKKAAAAKQKWSAETGQVTAFIDGTRQKGLMQLTGNESIIYNYKKRHILYNEGQKPKAVYYIIRGKIKVYKTSEDGKELIANMFTTGDFFAYLPVLQDINYKDNAEVLEDAEMMLIPRDDFKNLVTSDAQTAKEFIQLITHNMLEKEEDLVNLAYNSLRKKVAYGIVRLAEKYKSNDGKPTVIHLSREHTAQSIGIATESLIRTLADFKKEGLIDMQAGKIIILNENKLRNLPY